MAFTVTLYESFSKKENSTKRPSGGIGIPCDIKSQSGFLNPTLIFNIDNPRRYNYAYIGVFDRYYFINEWTYENGFWQASMRVDSLASWKQTIGGSTCYILRSASAYNLDVMDTTYPGINTSVCYRNETASPWTVGDLTVGTYVVGVAGQATTYYLFSHSELERFLNFIMSDNYVDALVDGWSSVFPQVKAQTNPLQYITSIKWFPFVVSGRRTNLLRVGFVDVETGVQELTGNGTFSGTLNFDIIKHPQADRGNYLNNSPFSSYSLFFPPWGTIQLDPNLVANSNSINTEWIVDLRTGGGTLKVFMGNDNLLLTSWVHSMVGVEHQVTQIINKGYGIGNLVQPVATALAGAVAGGGVGAGIGVIAGGVSAIGDVVSSAIPSSTSIGSTGGIDSLIGRPALLHNFKTIANEDLAHRGRPLCENRQISSLQGFMIVKDADIDLPCTQPEREEIKSYMEGGFFYE